MLETVVTRYIEQHRLLPASGSVVVAVSGGADSLCLLHLLYRLCGPGKRFPAVRLHVAHLNHQLRDTASSADAEAVAALAHAWQLPCTIGTIDVPALARQEQRSLEDAARTARYRFLRAVAAQLADAPDSTRIAVAHHQDDQVETLLLHWLRGGGIASMIGLQPLQRDIIRPLLAVTHAATLAYCQQQQLVPLEDASNTDTRFLRNRLRHELLPQLEAINPGFRATLLRNAEVMQVDAAWIEAQVDAVWATTATAEDRHSITLALAPLLALPLSIQRHLLRRASARLSEGQSPLELRHFKLLEDALHNREQAMETKTLHFPHHLHILIYGDSITITHNDQPEPPVSTHENTEVELTIPGRIAVPGTVWIATAEIVSEALAQQLRTALREHRTSLLSDTPYTVYVNGDLSGDTLYVRTRRPGDRLRPLGMTHDKKVQDIFVDNHIERSARAYIPLFFSQHHCIWLPGIQIDDRVRITGDTRRIIRLALIPQAER